MLPIMSTLTNTIEVATLRALFTSPPVVYFCAEFAIEDDMPIFAGGLGVLAGDVLRQANDDKRPFLGIGQLYHQGYVEQQISKEANVQTVDQIDMRKTGLQLLCENGEPVKVLLQIHARQVQVQCYVKMVGTVPLLLLDTAVEGNEDQDVQLSDRLYFGDREHRFKQEMVLGIAGLRMFRKLGITPRLFHLNEGHSSLLLFELVREQVLHNSSADIAKLLTNIENVVFTNHTLVAAGNDLFSKDLVISYLSSFAMEFPVDPSVLVNHGLIQDSSLFSPTLLSLRLATVAQAVSKLHAVKAQELWSDHPMIPVTNGVNRTFWQAPEIRDAQEKDDAALWKAHLLRKQHLIDVIASVTSTQWSVDDCIITWARRIASYKRPLLLFEDRDRLRAILKDTSKRIRFLISGKPHAYDIQGQDALRQLLELVGEFDGSIVYMQNYDLELAHNILSGSDLLLNTPVKGYEACGTSGMKACLNGVLHMTTTDGWANEVDWAGIGWALSDVDAATRAYQLLETEVIPLYRQRSAEDIPVEWVKRMRASIALIENRYCASRMLDELEGQVYSHTKVL